MAKFRKSVKIAPGIKLNFSKSGVSTTFGVKGASVNAGKDGVFLNTGIPGTGVYDRTKISGGAAPDSAEPDSDLSETETGPEAEPVKMTALEFLCGSMMMGGLVAFLLFLFFPGWPKRLIAAAVFVGGIVIGRVQAKIDKKAAAPLNQ
jgi:hypothetical protein